jgi:hypothetical protein
MASIVSAGTTSSTALNMSADTSGVLQLASNNGTTAVTIGTDQNVTFAGSINAPNSFGFKNRIINGAMVIDQRNAGASVTPANSYTLDRWQGVNTQASKFTVQQNAASVTPPAGFSNYLGVTSSSAYSVLTGDTFFVVQNIEGFNTYDLAWGTANAQTITISFWVRSSLTGTFGGALENNAANRSYPFSYTISSANTWEQKSITIAGDTSGTWVGATNGIGIIVRFGLGSGATFSGTAGAWAAGNFVQPTSTVSVVGTNGATFYITGVQLEKGSTATSFDYRDYGRELIMCQRYYQLAEGFSGIGAAGGTQMYSTMQFRTEMRASPSVSANANIQVTYPGVNDYTQSSPSVSITAGRASTRAIQVNVNNFTGITSLSPLAHNVGVNSASITLSSEL